MPELIEFDPTSENAANVPLSVMTSTYRLMSVSWASPAQNVLYASSIDTEGELPAARRPSNRTISMKIEVVGSSAATLRVALIALQAKVAKIQREGGTIKRTLVGGQVIVFDLLAADPFDPAYDLLAETGFVHVVDLQFTGKPYGRGAPVTLTAHSPNLVLNPSFEVDTSGWDTTSVGASTSRTRVADAGGDGAFALEVVCPATANTGATYHNSMQLVAGVAYTARIRLKRMSGTATLSADVYKVTGGTVEVAIATAVTPAAWTEYTVNFTASASGEFLIRTFINSAAATTYRVDAAMVANGSGVAYTGVTLAPGFVFTESGILGDAPGLGKMVVTDAAGVDQGLMIWGHQQLNYDSSVDAALYYEAEGRTAMSSSAIAAGPTGASGPGSNVMRQTNLSTTFKALLGTQAVGGGNHLKHVGDFTVLARVQLPSSNAGTVSVALEWAEGDFRIFTRNDLTAINPVFKGTWALIDLGQVHLSKVVAGTQRWEGRVLGKSTVAGDDIDIDCLMLVPVTEGSGRVQRSTSSVTAAPTAYSAYSDFTTEAGVITGDALTTGGVWVGAGSATDVSVAAGVATRTAVSDTSTGVQFGRVIVAGTPSLAAAQINVDAQRDVYAIASPYGYQGIVARYVDINNFLFVGIRWDNFGTVAQYVVKRVASVNTVIGFTVGILPTYSASAVMGLSATLDGAGGLIASFSYLGNLQLQLSLVDAALIPGATLATGKVGICDWWPSATASTRTYDNFVAYGPPTDAALFSLQSVEVRDDRVIREDSGGTLYVRPSSYEGDYLLIPPAGPEARTSRFFVLNSRAPLNVGADAGIDDKTAQMTYTPRYLVSP